MVKMNMGMMKKWRQLEYYAPITHKTCDYDMGDKVTLADDGREYVYVGDYIKCFNVSYDVDLRHVMVYQCSEPEYFQNVYVQVGVDYSFIRYSEDKLLSIDTYYGYVDEGLWKEAKSIGEYISKVNSHLDFFKLCLWSGDIFKSKDEEYILSVVNFVLDMVVNTLTREHNLSDDTKFKCSLIRKKKKKASSINERGVSDYETVSFGEKCADDILVIRDYGDITIITAKTEKE